MFAFIKMKIKASKAIGPARAFGVGAQSIDAVSIL